MDTLALATELAAMDQRCDAIGGCAFIEDGSECERCHGTGRVFLFDGVRDYWHKTADGSDFDLGYEVTRDLERWLVAAQKVCVFVRIQYDDNPLWAPHPWYASVMFPEPERDKQMPAATPLLALLLALKQAVGP